MKQRLVGLIVLVALVSGCAAGRAYRRGQESARAGDWDAAVTHFTRAVQENPDNAQFKISLERAMQSAARDHISRARDLESKDQLDGALLEYRKALDMDATNRLAESRAAELERIIRDRIEKSRPRPPIDALRQQARAQSQPLLNPANREPLRITFNNSSLRDVLTTLGELSGISVQFDRQFFTDAPVTVRLDGVTIEQALQQVLSSNGHFYKVLNQSTIIVAQDNPQAHAKYDELVVRVFYLSHSDPTEISQILNTVLRIPTAPQPAIFPNKTANTLTVRGTAMMVDVIDKVIRANDRPRAEVVIDVQILEVNRNRTKEFGLNLSNYALGLTFSPEVAPPNTPGPVPPTGPPPFNLNTISQGVSTADFYLTVPTAAVRFLANDTHTKQIAKPQLRGAEGTEMTLNLGEEIPVISTVFGAAVSGGFASIPQSSFNYRPVGVNIAMTPRVTYEGEVILDLTVESSTLGATISVAGQDVPSFGSRKVKTRLRLREGESNLLAGLLKDDQRKSLTGFPGVIRVPILRSLFGQTSDTVNQTDIVMLLTPHIVRTHELTADDLAPIYIGTQANVGLSGPPPLIAPLPDEPAPAVRTPSAVTPPVPGVPPPGPARPPVAAAPGVPPSNPPVPPGTSAVPNFPPPPPPPPAPNPAPTTTTPPAPTTTTVPGTTPTAIAPPGEPAAPRDLAQPPPTGPAGTAATQVIITAPPEMRVASGPSTVPLSVNSASRLSTMTLTVTYNPNVLRVRNVQEGTFMRQGGVTATFTPRIDAVAGRVDIAITRSGDQAGASGTGLLAALLFDAVGTGNSLIQVSGVANTPEGSPITLQFGPASVTVR
ncbi:MAG: secretin N-terminal domain-containing protein [Vicinamibacterales bacterium]